MGPEYTPDRSTRLHQVRSSAILTLIHKETTLATLADKSRKHIIGALA